MSNTSVILVDKDDNPVGAMEKMEAHRRAILHRAISVFVVDTKGHWLIHQRALDKYHSQGLWTNTCCSHPFPGETNLDAANRRLMEEMGLQCGLRELFSFTYKEQLDNDLTEHELDHVFLGISDTDPAINTSEVVDWKRLSFDELHADIIQYPHKYTCWFKQIYQRVQSCIINSEKC